MSKRAKILHRQTFQNSNNIVELTVKTIPKDNPSQKVLPKQPYVRDCALRKELEKVTDKENNNVVDKPPAAPTKAKGSGGRVTVQVSKKSSGRQHKVVPKNNTWEDVLRNCSSIESYDESNASDHSSGERKRQLGSRGISNHGQTWHQRSSHSPDTEQSNTSELIVNRQIQSGETSPQEFRPQRMSVDVREENASSRGRSSSNSSGSRRRMRISPGIERHRGRSQSNNVAKVAMLNVQPHQQLEQSRGNKVHGSNNRLFSDDVNSSPFGDSALQLLHQLRQRLQSRGDSEGMDIVGVVEAFITGQGSMAGVGAGNVPQSASTVSPACGSVFPTPTANIPTSTTNIPVSAGVEQNNLQIRPSHFNYSNVQGQAIAFPLRQPSHPEQYPPESQLQSVPPSFSHHPQRVPHDGQTIHPTGDRGSQQEEEEQRKQASDDILKREIAKQKMVISDQENDILQLRTLSTRLIAMQERLTSHTQEPQPDGNSLSRNGTQSAQPVKRPTQTQACQTEEFRHEKPTHDWDSNTPSNDRDYRSTLLLLETENETLLKEVRRLREITMDLQNQLTRAYVDLDSERRTRSRLSGLSSSKLSGSAPNLDLVERNFRETVPEKLISSKPPSNHGESEVDSAYEEKTSSRLTSKVGSPHWERQEGQGSDVVVKPVSSLPSCAKDFVSEMQNLNVVGGQYDLYQEVRHVNGLSRETTVPSINRNGTSLTEQVPVSQSGFPSMELYNSDYTSQKSNGSSVSSVNSGSRNNLCVRIDNGSSDTGSQRKNPLRSAAVISNINNNIAMLVSDIELKQGNAIEDPVYPSFSTVSEESHREATLTNQENSFLQGIPFPKFASGSNLANRETDPRKDSIHSINNIQNPTMESTRVQENSPPQADSRSSVDPSFDTMKGINTFTSTILSNIEELQ